MALSCVFQDGQGIKRCAAFKISRSQKTQNPNIIGEIPASFLQGRDGFDDSPAPSQKLAEKESVISFVEFASSIEWF